jgi:MFS family permease
MNKEGRRLRAGVDDKVRRSLHLSLFDSASSSIMTGAAEGYFQAFAVFLKATVFQVGLVSTLPLSVASLLQLASRPMLGLSRTRKRLTVGAGILRTALFIPLALVPFMGPARFWILLLLVCLYFTFIYMPTPAWTAWMRDLVAESERGRFFGRRNAIGSLTALAASVAVGIVLEIFSPNPLPGFLILFGVAFFGSLCATAFMSFEYDPAGDSHGQRSQSIASFSREMLRTNYGRFVAFNFVIYFGAYILSPFAVPFMLNELHFSYLELMVVISLVSLIRFLTMPLWGALGDRYGSRKILVLCAGMICLTPFTWLLARSFTLACLVQAFGAFAWSGFEIAALSFAYDAMPAATVTRQTSFLLLFRGAAVIGGGLVGGALLPHVSVFGSPSMGVFLVSGVFRVLFVFPMLFLLKEERAVASISYPALLLKLFTLPPRVFKRWVLMRTRGGHR